MGEARAQRADDRAEQSQRKRGRGLLDRGHEEEAEEPDGVQLRARGDGGGARPAWKGESLCVAPVTSYQIEIGGCRDGGLLDAVV